MKHFLLTTTLIPLLALQAGAAIVDKIPGPPGMPMVQGSMIHINIAFLDNPTGTFDITLDPGTPEMRPLALWSPGETFNPADPWYDELDPTQEAGIFSGRFGFLLDVAGSDPRPTGTSIGIRLDSASPGLDTYFYLSASTDNFDPVFLPAHDYVLWSGAMWHPIFVVPENTPENTPFSATFEIFLADAVNSGNVDSSTTASATPGYDIGTVTLNWTAIPEPSAAGVLLLAAVVAGWFLPRKKLGTPDA